MIEQDRVISTASLGEDDVVERAIRPRLLTEYVGQSAVKKQMGVFIQAARQRGEALDHCLIFGPPGLGKTTLAHIIANELNVNLRHSAAYIARATKWEFNEISCSRIFCIF